MHDVASRLPECLTRSNFPRFFTFQFEEDLALQYITEHRSGVAMRRESRVGRGEFDELCHRVRTLGNSRWGSAEEIGDTDVSLSQHGCVLSEGSVRTVARCGPSA